MEECTLKNCAYEEKLLPCKNISRPLFTAEAWNARKNYTLRADEGGVCAFLGEDDLPTPGSVAKILLSMDLPALTQQIRLRKYSPWIVKRNVYYSITCMLIISPFYASRWDVFKFVVVCPHYFSPQ